MDNGDFVMCNGLGTGGWQWMELQSYDLSAGDHTLSVTYREDGALLDKLCISNYILAPYALGGEASNVCEPDITPDEPNSDRTASLYDSAFNLKVCPNPFKDKIIIEFELQNQSGLSLNVHTLLGQNMIKPVGNDFTSGKHKVELGSGDLPPGIYIVTLTDENSNTAFNKILKGY